MKFILTAIFFILLSKLLKAQNPSVSHENAGSAINSAAGEISPVISADGKTLYFVRDGHPENRSTQDIWYSTRDANGNWNTATHPGPPLNQKINSAVFNVSADGNQLLIRGAFSNGIFESSGISMVKRDKKGNWDDPEKLEIENFDRLAKKGKYNGAFLCNDGKTLLLYFSDESNKGLSDIYVSHLIYNKDQRKKKNAKEIHILIDRNIVKNKWTEPEKAGTINTNDYDELAPFLAADGVTLYFSSNRPGTLGSNDIWKSTRLDDTWKNWSTPVNLGNSVNTADWDCYYTLDAKGEEAYMVSWKNSLGAADIVKINLTAENRPQAVVLITGKVYHAVTKEAIGDARIEYEDLPDGKNAGFTISNAQNGEYKLVLPYGKNYGFMALAEGYIAIADNIDLSKTGEYKEIKRDLLLVPLNSGSTVRLNNIFFDSGKSVLKKESFPELNRLAAYLAKNPEMIIEIAGYTDNIGLPEYNQQLSSDRAYAVYEYLLSKGVSPDRLSYKGYGENNPVLSNETEEGRQQNRRVVFTIIKN